MTLKTYFYLIGSALTLKLANSQICDSISYGTYVSQIINLDVKKVQTVHFSHYKKSKSFFESNQIENFKFNTSYSEFATKYLI